MAMSDDIFEHYNECEIEKGLLDKQCTKEEIEQAQELANSKDITDFILLKWVNNEEIQLSIASKLRLPLSSVVKVLLLAIQMKHYKKFQ